MTKFITLETEYRLRQWGQWCRLIEVWGLNHIHQLVVGNLMAGFSSTLHDYPKNNEAEEINTLVEKLGKK